MEIKVGDIFSELSQYVVTGLKDRSNNYQLVHTKSNQTVFIEDRYLQQYCISGNSFDQEIKVGREDKKDGTLGIRSIFENIPTGEVFTVEFKKQDKPLSNKKLQELKEKQIEAALEKITKVQKDKKGVLEAAKKELIEIQNNVILPYEEGEIRTLRGYKTQNNTRDGKYQCFDMDLEKDNIRPVNINTILSIITKNVKYIVE